MVKEANILYDLAVTDKYAGNSGKYFDNDHGVFGRPHANVSDQDINGLKAKNP